MALPLRLLGRLAGGGGGGRRRCLQPPLAVLHHHLSASDPDTAHPLPLPHRVLPPLLPFAVPARSFSWYSRSSPSAKASEEEEEVVRTEGEGVYLHEVGSVDHGEVVAGAAGSSADAVGVTAAGGGDGGSVSGFSVGSLIDLLDGFHNLTGIPWWITISLSTVAMRLLILPVLITQIKKAARIGELLPELPPPIPPPLSGRSFRDQFSLYRKKREELGCPSFLWNWAYFSVQFPCFILWMSTIRTMCLSNHPGLDNGGILWFHNLTEFPHDFLSWNPAQALSRLYLDILTIPLFLIANVIPQGSLVYWSTNGLVTVAQQLSLRNDAVKKMLGLPDTRAWEKFPQVDHKMKQQWPLDGAHMHTNLTSPDNGTANNIMEGTISESSSPEELLEQALQHLQTGFRDQAIPLIRTAIEKDPNLHYVLNMLYQRLKSRTHFSCLHAIVQAFHECGSILIKEGRKSEAVKFMQRAVAYDPDCEIYLKECDDTTEDQTKSAEH
uniref:ALBINO3-like protein 2, chloroplastic n=1 Tax=Leersia perrieri TaxID=77586 RepID=A0A0D9WME3_9ORYZ